MMAASAALMQSQVSALQQANEAMHKRRKRKRKALKSDKALSVAEVVAIVEQEQVEAQLIDEMPRLKKRLVTCSGCGQQGHTIRTCASKG